MTPARCPEYDGLRGLSETEQFEAEIALAERAGAISVTRERFGGEHARLECLQVVSLERLGAHLAVPLRTAQVEEAAVMLAAWRERYPVIGEVLAAWAGGRQVRGRGPDAAPALADAAKVVDARHDDNAQERLLRRESVRLFGDSKRLEALTAWLDLLSTGELTTSGLEPDHVWSSLGLRREPQPVLVAGDGVVVLADHRLPLCRPYLGLPVDAVTTIDTRARYVLTIENLTSFHDAARALPDNDGLLIYTGGMPSPPWRAFYARLIATLPPHTGLYHWGDIDEGGFRIAAALAAVATGAGKRLQPWRMSPSALPAGTTLAEAPSTVALKKMTDWALRTGWPDIASALLQTPIRIEQEALDPDFP